MLGSITTEQVYLELTFLTLAMLVVGGVTSLWGAVVGALAVSGLDSVLGNAEDGIGVGFTLDLPEGSRLVILGALMALMLILRPSGLTGGRELRAAEARRMRVCIVGCGAVGSLFAANLASLEDVEVWAYDLAREHVDAINEHGLRLTGSGGGARDRHPRDRRRRRAPALRVRDRRDEGDAHRGRDRGDRARVRGRRRRARFRTASATRRGSRRTSRGSSAGTTFPAGKILEPGVVQWDVKGDTTFGPFEPSPAGPDEIERLADACTRGGMPAQAVADARGAQWRKVIFNASTNPIGALTGLTHGRVCERPDLRAARQRARRRGQGRRGGAGDRARRRPRGADRPRGQAGGRLRPQGEHAAGRRGAPRRPRSTG